MDKKKRHAFIQRLVQRLVRMLGTGDAPLQESVEDALEQLSEAALDSLIIALDSGDSQVRAAAARVIGRLGSKAQPAEAKLRARLTDPDPEVRRWSARSLGALDVFVMEESTLLALEKLMNDLDEPVRCEAIDSAATLARSLLELGEMEMPEPE